MSTPVVTETRVVPVAGRDSMLLNLGGAHGPSGTRYCCATRPAPPASGRSRAARGYGGRWRTRATCSPAGRITLPEAPGLGVEVDEERVEAAHRLYVKHGLGDRDDAAAMEYLVPGWTFDPKRPCLVRD
ncbi:hypothetical protein [Actinomadura sp. 7K534]|uniref:hypothetical protein n=1 Tax=Actinomadura sp. 7K534 TaxID=2530366 RepID=UPI001FB58B07|nr:hypothetical protein [Actinomadura sp. 7K534]